VKLLTTKPPNKAKIRKILSIFWIPLVERYDNRIFAPQLSPEHLSRIGEEHIAVVKEHPVLSSCLDIWEIYPP
jgi:hypothetical protein